MNDRSATTGFTLGISAVERDTGLSKDTLRVWERRYGFPNPGRDGFGERTYPVEQVDKLRVIRRLMDSGHRPGKIIGLPIETLQALASQSTGSPRTMADANAEVGDLDRFIELVKAHSVEDLRKALSQAALRMGLERFVMDVCAPLNRMVGEAWARGYFEVFEEHLYTESMQVVLRNAISNIPQPGRRPRVLLTTFPNESHGLGLLMAEAVLALDGCRCTSLGTQTPIWDIVLAATSQHVDIVALSFSAVLGPNQVLDGLAELRAKLPRSTEIWAGGQCPALQRRPPRDVVVLGELAAIHTALAAWRASHPSA
jgi:DNA-binding transcriptional MerR regulator/methylmalonyl-CoA mutase cobalamin-binding subunit